MGWAGEGEGSPQDRATGVDLIGGAGRPGSSMGLVLGPPGVEKRGPGTRGGALSLASRQVQGHPLGILCPA